MSDINCKPDENGVPRCTEKCAGFKKGTMDYHLCLFNGEAMVPANGTCYPQIAKMAAALLEAKDILKACARPSPWRDAMPTAMNNRIAEALKP